RTDPHHAPRDRPEARRRAARGGRGPREDRRRHGAARRGRGGGADAARSRRRGGRARAGRPGRVSRGSALPAMLLGASLVLSAGLVAGAFNPAPHSGGDNAGYVALAHTLVSQHAYVDAYDP